jgi:hypothetical protein
MCSHTFKQRTFSELKRIFYMHVCMSGVPHGQHTTYYAYDKR